MLPLRDNIPRRHKPLMTGFIITINVVVYIYQTRMNQFELYNFIYEYGLVPELFMNQPLQALPTTITSMFLHGGLGHLLGNMWMLALFGDNVEDRMGKIKFLMFYLLSGLAAGLIHLLFNRYSGIPTIGASGAVSGVMAAYVFLFPLAKVLTVIPIFIFPYLITLPALVFVGIWFLTQVYYGTMALAFGEVYGGIAWWAHIGGFIFGALIYRVFLRKELRLYQQQRKL